MEKWIDVVTDPLGLAGFALFLVFALLTRRAGARKFQALQWVFAAMAVVALGGGLGLAYLQRGDHVRTAGEDTPAQPQIIDQKTEGAGSPAVSGVGGDVKIDVRIEDKSKPRQ